MDVDGEGDSASLQFQRPLAEVSPSSFNPPATVLIRPTRLLTANELGMLVVEKRTPAQRAREWPLAVCQYVVEVTFDRAAVSHSPASPLVASGTIPGYRQYDPPSHPRHLLTFHNAEARRWRERGWKAPSRWGHTFCCRTDVGSVLYNPATAGIALLML